MSTGPNSKEAAVKAAQQSQTQQHPPSKAGWSADARDNYHKADGK